MPMIHWRSWDCFVTLFLAVTGKEMTSQWLEKKPIDGKSVIASVRSEASSAVRLPRPSASQWQEKSLIEGMKWPKQSLFSLSTIHESRFNILLFHIFAERAKFNKIHYIQREAQIPPYVSACCNISEAVKLQKIVSHQNLSEDHTFLRPDKTTRHRQDM